MRERNDLAVVTSHFNWCNYRRPQQNLLRFLRQMEAVGIPVYGAEASLTGEFFTKDIPNWKHIKVNRNNICLQQEALCNAAESIVPEQYTKIAWIDHDVFFTNPYWYDIASLALDEVNLVQLFEECFWTDSRGRVFLEAKAMLSLGDPTEELVDTRTPTVPGYRASPQTGFAFAANRGLWREGGKLWPYNFWTGGDRAQLFGVVSPIPTKASLRNSYLTDTPGFEPYVNWKQKFYNFINGKTGYIKGAVYHEYHGEMANRGYGTGEKKNRDFGLNMKEHVILNESGLVEFKSPPPGWLEFVERHYINRREDSFEEEPVRIT